MTSASAASISTILPLPSSPHWAPTTATVFIADVQGGIAALRAASGRAHSVLRSSSRGSSKFNLRCGGNRRDDLEPFKDTGRNRTVHLEQAERGAADAVAPQFESGDIDPGFPEHRADSADDAGNVAIVQHQEVALGRRLDPIAVDPDQPQRAIPEHRAGDLVSTGGRAHGNRQDVAVVGGFARSNLGDLDSAIARDERGVDEIQFVIEKTAQQPLQYA